MATSGSFDFTLNRNEVIKEALEAIGRFRAEETLDAYTVQTCSKSLNLLLKHLQTKGMGAFLLSEAALFFEDGKSVYQLGPSGDRASTDFAITTISSAASSGAGSITVASTSGFADTYAVGIVLDDGTIQWTTQSGAVSGSTVTLSDTLTSAAASGNNVYVYSTKMQRPLEIKEARYVESTTYERPVELIGRVEYMDYTNKGSEGPTIEAYHEPARTNTKLYLWPTPDNRSHYLKFTVRRPIEDLDNATDDIEIPPEWTQAIIMNLAVNLMPKFGVTLTQTRMDYKREAREAINDAMGHDMGNIPLVFEPDLSDYENYT